MSIALSAVRDPACIVDGTNEMASIRLYGAVARMKSRSQIEREVEVSAIASKSRDATQS